MPRIEAPTLAEHQALRRSALVQAAAQILAVDGPHAITPAAVAAMAGLARSSTYQYFPSTAALIRAGVEEFFRAAMERIETEVPAEGAPMDRIEAYIASTLDSAVSGHTAMMRLSSLDLPKECHDRVRELHDQFGDIVGADPLLDHLVSRPGGRLGLRRSSQLALEGGDIAIQELGGGGVVTVALEPVGLGTQVVDPGLELADPVEPGLLGLPPGVERGELVGLVGEVLAQPGKPLDRSLVALLGQVQLLHRQPVDGAAELVDLDWGGVDLHPQPRGGLVDQVDGLVGQLAAADEPVRERRGGDERRVLDLDLVVGLVALLEPAEDGDGVLDAGLTDIHLLETALQRRVLLDVLAVLVQRRRADHPQLATGQQRLEHVAGVHGALAGRAGTDDGVQLVDEGDDLPLRPADLLEDGLEPLLELAAVLRPGDHRAEIQADEPLTAQ